MYLYVCQIILRLCADHLRRRVEPGPGGGSGEDVLDRLGVGLGQRDRARADVVVLLMIDAQGAVDGGEQLGGADLAVDDGLALVVGPAVDRPPPYPPTR